MAILVDRSTRLVVQGLTGSEGRFHGLRNRSHGTDVVARVTPGKGGPALAQLGLGNSTIVGIGGDPVVGSSFVDGLACFESDPQTEQVVLVGEIGGEEEEKAAVFIESEMTKPVVAYIAGFTAPPGK